MYPNIIEQDIEKIIVKPDKVREVLESLIESNPKETKKAIHYACLGHHLDEEMMNEALSTITRYDGARAPFWTVEEFNEECIKNNISCIGKSYNEYDLNFMTQYYLADFKSLGQKPITFINLAIDKFNDIDDPKAHETAYWTAKMRICRRR